MRSKQFLPGQVGEKPAKAVMEFSGHRGETYLSSSFPFPFLFQPLVYLYLRLLSRPIRGVTLDMDKQETYRSGPKHNIGQNPILSRAYWPPLPGSQPLMAAFCFVPVIIISYDDPSCSHLPGNRPAICYSPQGSGSPPPPSSSTTTTICG